MRTPKLSPIEPDFVSAVDSLLMQECEGQLTKVVFKDEAEAVACERHLPVLVHLTREETGRVLDVADEGTCEIKYPPQEQDG